MTLKNLLGISLDAITADRASVGMLVAAAKRNIALIANGYRTLKSKPGYH